MLRTGSDQKQIWTPEADAVLKKAKEEPQDDKTVDQDQDVSDVTQDATPGAQDFVAVRVSRSQSLTDPKTPPMFVSPTTSNNSPSADFVETAVGSLAQPLSEPDRTATTAITTSGVTLGGAHQNPPPLVSAQQLANDPRFARRNRRSMSAEFTLSMLQQELGYPKRKYSKSRRDSVEKSRRTSSILEEESQDSDSNSASAAATAAATAAKSSDGGVLSNPRSEDAITISSSSSSNELHSNNMEPEPERMSRLSIESASKYPSANSSTKRGSYSSTHDCDTNDEDIYADDNEEDEEENFLDSRVASITGFSQDTDGVVYYEIIVKSTAHGPLSAYKVRRRYSEFRDLHRALSKVMPTTRRVSFDSPPGFSDDDDEHAEGFLSSFQQTPPPPAARGARTRDWGYLPPMPDRGGVWSYFQFDTTPFLERRAKYFQALLVACQSHPRARESRLLNEFLGPPPDSVALHTSVENSYVSLNRFAAPKLRLSVEAQERKQKARNISRRRSSVHRASRPSEP